jgi:hypothetical protein
MNFARHAQVMSAFNRSPKECGDNLRRMEIEQGFTLVEAAIWFDPADWHERSIVSQDGKRIRLVALQAREPGNGAFTRLIAKIFAAGLTPVLVEPNEMMENWCHRHNYRRKRIGQGEHRHEIWYPRRW